MFDIVASHLDKSLWMRCIPSSHVLQELEISGKPIEKQLSVRLLKLPRLSVGQSHIMTQERSERILSLEHHRGVSIKGVEGKHKAIAKMVNVLKVMGFADQNNATSFDKWP